ncbi:MAG: diacylglycerol kinase family lipid kinase, partial [Actinomycetota bacterium]|nr:diacylglycerol kinase family lipid kinase [Actinomycetota bacterium]
PEVRRHLDARELEYEIAYTEYPGHASELARRAPERGINFLVAVGGDGTVHEVVNGLIENDHAVSTDAVLGIIGSGTGADFIRTFGIPSLPGHAVAHLDGPGAFPIDIGKVTFAQDGGTATRYFANIAEVGFGASVVERSGRLPRWLGPTRYVVAFWLTIRKRKMAQVVVDLVDRSYEGPMNNLVVANGQFFGGGMRIAPKAAPTDGVLDIQIEHAGKRESIATLPQVFRGEHVPHRDIFEAKRVRASIQSDDPLRIEADGELLGYTPASFEVLRDAIRLKV